MTLWRELAPHWHTHQIGVVWLIPGVVWLIFAAMNYYTHVGSLVKHSGRF